MMTRTKNNSISSNSAGRGLSIGAAGARVVNVQTGSRHRSAEIARRKLDAMQPFDEWQREHQPTEAAIAARRMIERELAKIAAGVCVTEITVERRTSR